MNNLNYFFKLFIKWQNLGAFQNVASGLKKWAVDTARGACPGWCLHQRATF